MPMPDRGRFALFTPRAATAVLLALVAALLAGAACGGEAVDPVDRAERSLRDLQSGQLRIELTATPADGEPVGFSVEGPFSVKGDEGEHVVARLEYRQMLGSETVESTLISTGDAAWIETADGLLPLDESEMESLRLDDGRDEKPAGLGELDLSKWVRSARTSDGPELDGERTKQVVGTLDAEAFIADLAALAADTTGEPPSTLADGGDGDRDRLQSLVERSTIEILLSRADDAVRRIDARVRFAGDVPDEVRKTLGRYAAVDLRLVVEIDEPNKPVKVSAPSRRSG